MIGQLALLAIGGTMILFAIEGAVCLVMAVPIAVADRDASGSLRRTSARPAPPADVASRISRSCFGLVSLGARHRCGDAGAARLAS